MERKFLTDEILERIEKKLEQFPTKTKSKKYDILLNLMEKHDLYEIVDIDDILDKYDENYDYDNLVEEVFEYYVEKYNELEGKK